MAIVRNIKCYDPENSMGLYHARCDTDKGQIDSYGHSEGEAISNLKGSVIEMGLKFPHVVPKSTGKGSTVYEIIDHVEEPPKPEPVKEPKEEPKEEVPAPKKASKKKASTKTKK